jgi:outer membrane receptor protein involved in Fe transport
MDGSYQFAKIPLSLRAGIDNIANKGPPVVRGTAGVTSPTTYDTVGRRFYVGGTLSF